MRSIILTQGKVALVDDDDFEALSKYKWNYHESGNKKKGYARTGGGNNWTHMHHMLCPVKEGQQVDHIDGNPLNNQRNNLRVCTSAQNNQNRTYVSTQERPFKGVCRNGTNWRAYITHKKKYHHIGNFPTQTEAALAYDKKAREFFGEFAKLNYPEQLNSIIESDKCQIS